MKRLIVLLAVLVSGAATFAAEGTPAPATVTVPGGQPQANVFVTSETLDGITWTLDPRDANSPKLSKAPGKYTVEYKASTNSEYLSAEAFEHSKPERALESYTKVVTQKSYDWEKQNAYIAIGHLCEDLKKYDDGIQALDAYAKAFPRGLKLAEAQYQTGRLQALKGDGEAAQKTFETLRGRDKELGIPASVLGALGSGDLLATANKLKEACDALTPLFTDKVNPALYPDEYARLGLSLGDYQSRQKDPAAIETFRKVAFAPCSIDAQSRAHLGWGKELVAKGDPASALSAFDHFAITAALKGTNPAARTEALRAAKDLVPVIATSGADETMKNKLTIEYKGYLDKLR